ncbi:anti-sigma factor family protein [Paenibacillus sp. Z6-24]
MKREVAEEWMSRYLDGDLNGEDTKALFRYMDENPEAAETFRIMTALSLRLEKLPDVTPKYSLVDAILPQLDLLDEGRRTESASEIGIMEPQQDDQDELADRRRQRRTWRERLPVRTIGGIVAAGVVLGVSIASYEPKTLTDAGPPSSPFSYKQQEESQSESGNITPPADTESNLNPQESDQPSSGSQEPSSSKDTKEPETSSNTPSAGESTNTPTTSKEPESDVTTRESTSTPNTREEQPPASGNRGGIPSGDKRDSGSSSGSSQQPATNPEASSSQRSSSTDSGKTTPSANTGSGTANNDASQDKKSAADSKSNADDAPSIMSQESTTPDPEASGNAAPKADAPPADTPTLDSKSTERSLLPSGVNAPKQEQEWKAPGAEYTVVLTTDNILRLDSIAEDNVNGRTVVSSISLKGTLISGRWSEDGKTFTYQVNESGISKTYKISIGNN